MPHRSSTHQQQPGGGEFHTTCWSMVIGAQGRSPGDTRASFATFYRQYWAPLYTYARRRGHPPHDAQDLTQEFFTRLLEKDWLAAADPERGRLRTFLLVTMQRFLANEWDRARAGKRGGGIPVVSIHGEEAERLYESASATLPDETLYDRNWALALMQATLARLRGEFARNARHADFEILKSCLTAERGDIDYAAIATALHLLPASARSVVHRFRKRFREIFREEVAATVASEDEVDDEMRAVIATLGHL